MCTPPFFYEGTKTYIYEVWEQLHRIPRNLVIPVGNGTLFLGAILALEHLLESGVISQMPQIWAVQSEHCDPLLQGAERGEKADRHTGGAGGVQRGKMGVAAGAVHEAGAGKGQHFSICGPVSAQLFGCIEQLRRTGAAA